ncbi:hypothetical protein ACTFIW_000982 [Dictyostelium discoideum]
MIIQGLLVEEECILKKDEISELNKGFNFPSNFRVNVAPFGTPEGITVSSTFASHVNYLAQSAIVLAVNAQASLSCVLRNNIAKEIYGSEVLLPIKIKDTPKMFDETETERVRELANGNNTTGNSSNSKSSSGSNGRSNNFNGSPSNVASGSNNTKSANGTNNRFQKDKK